MAILKDDEEEGAPSDFGGVVLPNPNHLRPLLDTESATPATRLPEGVTFQNGNWTGAPQMDMANPAAALIIPGVSTILSPIEAMRLKVRSADEIREALRNAQ